MARNKKCGCGSKILSNIVKNMDGCCMDVCRNPIYADPDVLSIYAPLIYDEIGINLCATFSVGAEIATEYPTARCATVQIVNVTYTYDADTGVTLVPAPGRPNCYLVTLSNLVVQMAVNLYDDSCRLLGTVFVSPLYLPPVATDTYDEDTNPSSVSLEIFAPYGVSYELPADPEGDPTPVINYIGNATTLNGITQGINLYAIPKVLNFDTDASTITVGITLVLQSLYFAGYRVDSKGKINTQKGCIETADETACMRFVAGDLLNLAIKPLDLSPPLCEGNLKQNCDEGICCGISQD